GLVSPQQSWEHLSAKLQAFGWEMIVIDGHDPDTIAAAFAQVGKTAHPLAILARTIKGWGVDELQHGNWHGKPLAEKELPDAYASLDRHAPNSAAVAGSLARPSPPAARASPARVAAVDVGWPTFAEAMNAA